MTGHPTTYVQKRVLEEVQQIGHVFLSSAHNAGQRGFAGKQTLRLLVERGLVEWADTDGWPYVQKVGTNAQRRLNAIASEEAATTRREARTRMLTTDARALAEAVVALEEKLRMNP